MSPNRFHSFSWKDVASWIFKGKIKREMRCCTGSQMHAIQDPAASTDMTKQGRKYGNLKIDAHFKGLSRLKATENYMIVQV
jgi:hypothetical protein